MKKILAWGCRVIWSLIKLLYAALLLMTALIMWMFCTLLTLLLAI